MDTDTASYIIDHIICPWFFCWGIMFSEWTFWGCVIDTYEEAERR